MKLIKEGKSKYPSDGRPTFVYDDGDYIIKEIPYQTPTQNPVINQIRLINSILNLELISSEYSIKEKPNVYWQEVDGKRSNVFLKYKMKKIPYVFDLEKNVPHKRGPDVVLPPLYTDMDLYLKHILTRYIELNIKLYPYHNVDNCHGNVLQTDIGKPVIIDWDDALLGHEHTSQRTGELLIKWAVESVGALKVNYSKENIIKFYKKTFDFYEELTYNTVLQHCNIDVNKMANESYKELDRERNNG